MVYIPQNYTSPLGLYDTQTAIGLIKQLFSDGLASALNLKRVSAPLFVDPAMGLNDNLDGKQRPVSFDIPATGGVGEIVHSLAKWKRLALHRYQFYPGRGLYTDMNAIRRDETLSNIHSIYVDQWDWEKILPDGMRNEAYLQETVRQIVGVICDVQQAVHEKYGLTLPKICSDVYMISYEKLAANYPHLSPKERENEVCKQYGTVFLQGIGMEENRAPDYDDWTLNGDILIWNPVLRQALELSSMGIRVDGKTLDRQLALADCDNRRELPFHQMLLENQLPATIGGGIGQSRLCMLFLGAVHIGQVQSAVWDTETHRTCQDAGITLL